MCTQRQKSHYNCTTEAIYSTTCSAFSLSLLFTVLPTHLSQPPAQFKFSRLLGGWSTYLVEIFPFSTVLHSYFFIMFCSLLSNIFFTLLSQRPRHLQLGRFCARRKIYKWSHYLVCMIGAQCSFRVIFGKDVGPWRVNRLVNNGILTTNIQAVILLNIRDTDKKIRSVWMNRCRIHN